MSKHKNERKILMKFMLPPLLIFFIASSIRFPLFNTVFWRTPDAAEYINVARNINSGKGLTQSIKWHYFDESPVETSALKGRPIMTSLILSPVLKIFGTPVAAQFLILIIGAFNAVLFYYLARLFLSVRFSFVASLLVALNPNILISNRSVLSEFLSIFFILLALNVLYRLKNVNYKIILSGTFLALSYLTRIETLILLPLFAIYFRRNKKHILLLILVFLILTLPYFTANYLVNGNPFYTYNTNHFKVGHFSEGMGKGLGQSFPDTFDYVGNNINGIISKITAMVVLNIKSLADFAFFGFLIIPLLLFFKERKNISKFPIEILFSVYLFVWYSITWSAFIESERGFMVIYILLLLPAFYVLTKMRKPFIFLIIAVTLISYLILDVHRINWARTTDPNLDSWSFDERKKLYSWIEANTGENEIIGSTNPWLINLNTERPSIITPDNISEAKIKILSEKYNASYLISGSALNNKHVLAYSGDNVFIYCLKKVCR